jgi:HSP20 family protein
MTTLTRLVPVRSAWPDVSILQDRLNSLFQEFSRPESEAGEGSSFVPPVDIYEDAQKLVLKLEVPGIKQEDLDLRVENQILTVKGERKFESEEKQENYHRIERRFGSFIRTFTLPQTVDTEAVTANYDAGVLSISVAKKAEAKPKQIKVQLGTAPQAKQVEGEAAKQ